MNLSFRLILASKSPRRQSLLKDLGLSFEVRAIDVDESYPTQLTPSTIPQYLAEKKADAQDIGEEELVITADTVVIENGEILGKPKDSEEAIKILNRLSGKSHEVVTGVCIRSKTQKYSFSEVTKVFFKELEPDEISAYVEKFNPLDKAGAYGIQEWIGMIGIEKIEGDYYNVVGLPLNSLWNALKTFQ